MNANFLKTIFKVSLTTEQQNKLNIFTFFLNILNLKFNLASIGFFQVRFYNVWQQLRRL